MCPITLTIIISTTVTLATSIASGAGIAAAATAAVAAGSAAATGAGLGAAIGVGAAAAGAATAGAGTAALTIGGAVAFGTAATAAGGTVAGAGAGIAGTAMTVASIGVELAAFASIGQGIHSHNEAVALAKDQEESALMTADIEKGDAFNEAVQENRVLAEEGAIIEIQQARDRGKASNLMNRSDMQVASLLREADREAQTSEAALATKTQNVRSSLRGSYRSINIARNERLGSIKKPSKGSLALGLGTTAVSSLTAL
jgi:hypothetical protein